MADMDSAFERQCSGLVARERSGHAAVVEENLLYVWGGFRVRTTRSLKCFTAYARPVLILQVSKKDLKTNKQQQQQALGFLVKILVVYFIIIFSHLSVCVSFRDICLKMS